MINKNQRVYVDDFLFKGWGVIEHIIPGEMFGIQLRMEEPDSDGHYIHRVNISQIKEKPDEKPSDSQIELREAAEVIAESNVNSLNLKEGQSYLLSASKYMQGASSLNCYVYRIGDRKFLGCHPKSCFGNWCVFDGKEVLKEAKEENAIIVEAVRNVDQENLGEQLSLFDL